MQFLEFVFDSDGVEAREFLGCAYDYLVIRPLVHFEAAIGTEGDVQMYLPTVQVLEESGDIEWLFAREEEAGSCAAFFGRLGGAQLLEDGRLR